jgi:hypothetical protein
MYVDNNGIRHNCHELLTAFESDVAADGRIDLHREGDMSSFLYLNKTHVAKSPPIKNLTSILFLNSTT